MEYGYAIVTPYGYENGVQNKIVTKLINEGFENPDFKTLISVSELSGEDFDKLNLLTQKRNAILTKSSIDTVLIVLVKGNNATNKLKDIVNKAESEIVIENDDPELLKVYVSNDGFEAINDFCEYTGIENFNEIESDLNYSFEQKEIGSFNFKDLIKSKSK